MSNIRQCDICHRKINKVYSVPFRKAKVSTFSIWDGWITDNIDICMDCAREIEQRVKESSYEIHNRINR